LSPTPTASGNIAPSEVKFNDSCPIFASSPLRSVYESVVNSFKLIKKYSSPSARVSLELSHRDKELETRIDSLATHPIFE
jgi:hypothetical protein